MIPRMPARLAMIFWYCAFLRDTLMYQNTASNASIAEWLTLYLSPVRKKLQARYALFDSAREKAKRSRVCMLLGFDGAGRRIWQHDHRQDPRRQHSGSPRTPENGWGNTRGQWQESSKPRGAPASDPGRQGKSVAETGPRHRSGWKPTSQVYGERAILSISMSPVIVMVRSPVFTALAQARRTVAS